MVVVFSRLAELDLEEIWLYTFEKWSIERAHNYQNKIIEGINEMLANLSNAKQLYLSSKIVRYYKIGRHFVFFEIDSNEFRVLRVLHEIMDLERHL